MKTATIPPVRVDPDLRREMEQNLHESETLAGLVEVAVRREIAERKAHDEFVRRGLASIARAEAEGSAIPADAVIARLEARLAAARAQHGRA